jgi:4-nitrophenyl phosphatase
MEIGRRRLAEGLTQNNVRDAFAGVKAVLFDCDGVLWNGDHVFPGVPESLRYLRDGRGLTLRYITNNATMSRADMLRDKFSRLECGVQVCEVLSSAAAAQMALRSYGTAADGEPRQAATFDRGNVLVLGNPGLHKELEDALAPGRFTYGLELRDDHGPGVISTKRPYDMKLAVAAWDQRVLPAPSKQARRPSGGGGNNIDGPANHAQPCLVSLQELDIAAVVVGFDFCFCPAVLALATMILQRHDRVPGTGKALYIATNEDPQISYGELGWALPGCGTMQAAVKTATGRVPDVVCGKPSQNLFTLLQEQAEATTGERLRPDECLMIGDRLTTDIAFGNGAGARTLLVLTGCETRADIPSDPSTEDELNLVPDFVADSLAQVTELLRSNA